MSDGKFVVRDTARGNERECDSRAEAESKRQDLLGLGADSADVEIVPPNTSDGGESAASAEVVEDTGSADAEAPAPAAEEYDLPEQPPVDEDPITWMPTDFTDEIDGETAINRKGYEVMAHYYGIGTTSECVVGPEEMDYTYARVHATATTDDGVTYGAQGSAHTDRGDDAFLLLEMADTRARKRAIAQATGVGMVAVSELQNSL